MVMGLNSGRLVYVEKRTVRRRWSAACWELKTGLEDNWCGVEARQRPCFTVQFKTGLKGVG